MSLKETFSLRSFILPNMGVPNFLRLLQVTYAVVAALWWYSLCYLNALTKGFTSLVHVYFPKGECVVTASSVSS